MAKTKKPKTQQTLRRQAWDTFKSGYARKGMDDERFDFKSKNKIKKRKVTVKKHE